jgi:hypothetical protein
MADDWENPSNIEDGCTIWCDNEITNTVQPAFMLRDLCFPNIYNTFSGPLNFPIFIMYCLSQSYVYKISNFPQFTSLESLQEKEFWHKQHSLRKLLRFTSLEHLQMEHFDIKCSLLRDCLYLHVLSCSTIAIRRSAIQLRWVKYIALQNKKWCFLFDNHRK